MEITAIPKKTIYDVGNVTHDLDGGKINVPKSTRLMVLLMAIQI
jgi:hypothetical protein